MWIFCKNGTRIINSNLVKCFDVTSFDENILWADDIAVCKFQTPDMANKELKQIYLAISSGTNVYAID